MGDRGCSSLFGDQPSQHRLLADNLTAEYRVAAEVRGRVVDEWKFRPMATITGSTAWWVAPWRGRWKVRCCGHDIILLARSLCRHLKTVILFKNVGQNNSE